MKKIIIFFMIAAFSLGSLAIPAFAMDEYKEEFVEKPNYWSTNKADAMLYDIVILRPVGLASVIVGAAATIVAFPFSITSNSSREVGDAMIGETSRFTFCRPLGEIFPPAEY
jgi:ABC-type phosphate transport system permease subunit